MRQIFSSGSLGETCALARAAAAAAAARAAAASASGFCANAVGPKRPAATRQLAVSIQIFLIPSSLGSCRAPLDFFALRPVYRVGVDPQERARRRLSVGSGPLQRTSPPNKRLVGRPACNNPTK